jgi:hypothetical protein
MKKKAGTSAGIPRASGERTSPAPNGFLAAQVSKNYVCLVVEVEARCCSVSYLGLRVQLSGCQPDPPFRG